MSSNNYVDCDYNNGDVKKRLDAPDENNNEIKAKEAKDADRFAPGDYVEPVPDLYLSYKFGDYIPRVGKVFSYTFWRIRANADVFWSIQGNNEMEGAVGGIWIATQYFGNPSAASKYRQEITLTHPTEHKIQMTYASTLTEGENCVFISKSIVQHFHNADNSIDFDFRVVRAKKNHRNRKKSQETPRNFDLFQLF